MQLAFCLYKYFPFGGLQRDFLRIAQACQARGHALRVYTLTWEGEVPSGLEVIVAPVRALSNVRRNEKFTAWVQKDLTRRPADRVVGFNKMPELDVYFAADPCYEEKASTLRSALYRFSARYQHFSTYERAVFAVESSTEILLISSQQQVFFERHYATPAARFHLLPPGISPDRRRPDNALEIRSQLRQEFALADDALLLLQVGSGFKTKGVDRSLAALAALPAALKPRTRLIVIGQDDPKPFQRLANSLGVTEHVTILPGRSDIPRFLLGADLLIHPAYNENTGTILLEALVAGLPVLASAICGYAHYITDAEAGEVIPEPFAPEAMQRLLTTMLKSADARARWQKNALRFAETADIYNNAEYAADVILKARP